MPEPPRPDRVRRILGSFSWIDHRFLREGFDEGLDRLEKLLYFVLIAVSNRDGVSFYSDQRLGEMLDLRFPDELRGARAQLVARDLIAYEKGVYQVLALPAQPLPPGQYVHEWEAGRGSASPSQERTRGGGWKDLRGLLRELTERDDE